MADPEGGERRTPETRFTDPAGDHAAGHDSMAASLSEMERARSARPGESNGHDAGDGGGGSAGEGVGDAARRDAVRAAPRSAEQPWLAAGIGFTSGYLLACLLRGGRRSS